MRLGSRFQSSRGGITGKWHLSSNLLLAAVVISFCVGRAQTLQTYQQSVKTSTSFSTQVLTTSAIERLTVTRTTLITVAIVPDPAMLIVKFEWRGQIERGPWREWSPGMTPMDMLGNITNRSGFVWQDLRLKFVIGDGPRSEVFHYKIPILYAGETKFFVFSYTPREYYDYRYAWVKFLEIDQYETTIKTKTSLQTGVITETTDFIRTATLTSTRMILSTYSEPETVGHILGLTAAIVGLSALAAFALLRKRHRKKETVTL